MAQMFPSPGPNSPYGHSAGTLSLRTSGTCSMSAGNTTCSISKTGVAGDLDVFACYSQPNTGTIARPFIASVTSGVGTLQFPIAANAGAISGVNTQASFAYVLPSTSGSVSSPIVITMASASTNDGVCGLWELTPSAGGSTVALANDFNYVPAADCTNCTNANIILNGTNAAVFQGFVGGDNFVGPTAVASPYATNAFLGVNSSWAGMSVAPAPSNGNGAAWTNSSVLPQLTTLAWSFSPAAFLPQQFQGFEGGTNGSAPSATNLIASQKGTGCNWGVTAGVLQYATAASMPLINSMGLLGDGSTVSAGAGSLGMAGTSAGAGLGVIQCNNQYSNVTSSVLSFKVNDNFVITDNTDEDIASIHSQNDYGAVNWYGTGATRYILLETLEGNGSVIDFASGTSATDCGTFGGGTGCTVQLIFNANTGGNTASATASVATGTVTFAGTFTAANWPVGYPFSATGCTGGTNYNNNLYFVTSSSGTTITASASVYPNGGTTPVAPVTVSGTAAACTIAGQLTLLAYNSTGTFIGASFRPGFTGADFMNFWQIFDSIHNVTSGKTIYVDSVNLSYNLTKPVL